MLWGEKIELHALDTSRKNKVENDKRKQKNRKGKKKRKKEKIYEKRPALCFVVSEKNIGFSSVSPCEGM
jgi:hypothetical protein